MVVKINKHKPKKHLVKNKTRKNKTRKNKYGYKYRIYSGGVTPVLSPASSMTPVLPSHINASPLNVSPVGGPAGVNPVDMSVLPLGVQAYAYNRNTPYSEKVISAKKLEGQERLRSLTHSQKIHSWGNEALEPIIKSPLKRKSPPMMAPSVAAREATVVPNPEPLPLPPPPLTLSPPIAPNILLSSKGRLKTTYTPTLDIVEISAFTINKKSGSGTLPGIILLPFTYNLPVILPLSFLPKHDDIAAIIGQKLFDMIDLLNTYNEEYSGLSPRLHTILKEINKTDKFGVLIIWGRLQDDLFENIAVSNIDAIQSRTLFDEETTRLFMDKVKQIVLSKDTFLGPSPSNEDLRYPTEMRNFIIPTPKHSPNPSSLQVVGYNTHPMFNIHLTRNDELQLLQLSEENKQTKPSPRRETIFISAHGGIGNELSNEMKILANKYLRVIELGKMHELVSPKYSKLYLIINDILLDPKNAVMFNNTTAGENKRKEIFDIICKYIHINKMDACLVKNTLSLTDLTHDRVFGGHFNDDETIEDHDINIITATSLYSTGIFIPIDYKKNKKKQVLYKKPIFELYPGTAYFTKSTSINMIETLLPIAIRDNKIMNILIYSCAPKFVDDDEFVQNPDPTFQKPGIMNPAIKLLTEGKKFLYSINRMFSWFIYLFFNDNVTEVKTEIIKKKATFIQKYDYFPVGKPPQATNILLLRSRLNDFYARSFVEFLNEIIDFNFISAFSFSGLGNMYASYDLVEPDNPVGNTPYANELIKVKIYLMEECYNMLSTSLAYFINVSRTIIHVLNQLMSLYTTNSQLHITLRATISNDILQATSMSNFFDQMRGVIIYITNGFYGDDTAHPPLPPVFLYFPKYIQVKKEYDESNVRSIYDQLSEGLDYYRYKKDIPDSTGVVRGYGESGFRGLMVNPLPPGQMRRTARHLYKYRVLPNIDEVKNRRKTMKVKLYDEIRVGKQARLANKSSHISI